MDESYNFIYSDVLKEKLITWAVCGMRLLWHIVIA